VGFIKATANFEIDPLVRSLTLEKVKEDITGYLSLLDAKPTEARLHEFLASHSYFFNGILRLYGYSPLYSKVKLGHDYEVDFAWFDSGSMGPEWRLAEIESPVKPMFTKSGEPSATLTHAMQQVRDWHTWLHDNADYARKLMPHIEYPMGYVFIGRRHELSSVTTKKRLRRLIYENRMFLDVHTLDWFATAAHSVIDLVGRGGSGNWQVPMKALTHSDLAQGLSLNAQKWMADPFTRQALDLSRQYRLDRREYAHLSWPEEDETDE
jgi:hypothetical protein